MIISKEKLEKIRNIIRQRYNYLKIKFGGPDVLSVEEIKELEAEGLLTPGESVSMIEDAYHIGRARNDTRKPADREDMSLSQFEQRLKVRSTPITDAEKYALEHAKESMGSAITSLGNKFKTFADSVIANNNLDYRNSILTDEMKPVIFEGIERGDTIAQIASDLRDKTGEAYRDWKRVAATEISSAMNLGEADAIVERNPGKDSQEIYVFKYVNKDGATCKHCKRAYLNFDGSPKIFKLSELQANGNNYGVKAADYKPTIGPLHPLCRCHLVELPPGFKFAEDNSITYAGLGYEHYKNQK